MQIKLPQIEITEDAPFANDALDRDESAEILTQFVRNLEEPYVIAIDSAWGTGKSTFLKMWQAHLKKSKIHSLYFNAWATDFNDNPLIALINEIELQLNCLEIESKKKAEAKKHLQAAKNVSYNLIKKGIPAAIKLVTAGLLDTSELTEEVLSSLSEEIAKEQFVDYEKAKKSLINFKNSLQKFANEVSENGPLVFIIDEMDRCRPNYAIQLLEKVKHLFSIQNLVFVLGIDKKQIGFSIQTLYGQGMDVEGYLSRFIDFDYHLPPPNKKAFIEFTIKRYELEKKFFSLRKRYPNLKHDQETMTNIFSGLFALFNFSLRQIEQILSQLVIVIKVTKENEFLHPSLLCLLLSLRKGYPELYKKIKNSQFSIEEIMELKLKTQIGEHYESLIKAYFEVSMSFIKTDYNPVQKYQKEKENSLTSEAEKQYAENMIKSIDYISYIHSGNIIEFLIRKIEIAQRFH